MSETFEPNKQFLLVALSRGIVPRTTRDGLDMPVSEGTARILADSIRSGQSFSSYEGDAGEVTYPDESAPGQAL